MTQEIIQWFAWWCAIFAWRLSFVAWCFWTAWKFWLARKSEQRVRHTLIRYVRTHTFRPEVKNAKEN